MNQPLSPTTKMPQELVDRLTTLAGYDVEALEKAHESYGESWKKRGGTGAFMMLARKWDRIENQLKGREWDILNEAQSELATDYNDGILDDIRDLRRYLLLVEAECYRLAFGHTEEQGLQPNPHGTQEEALGDAGPGYVNQDR